MTSPKILINVLLLLIATILCTISANALTVVIDSNVSFELNNATISFIHPQVLSNLSFDSENSTITLNNISFTIYSQDNSTVLTIYHVLQDNIKFSLYNSSGTLIINTNISAKWDIWKNGIKQNTVNGKIITIDYNSENATYTIVKNDAWIVDHFKRIYTNANGTSDSFTINSSVTNAIIKFEANFSANESLTINTSVTNTYQLSNYPVDVSSVVVHNETTTFQRNVDYDIDENGTLTIVAGGALDTGTDINVYVDYNYGARNPKFTINGKGIKYQGDLIGEWIDNVSESYFTISNSISFSAEAGDFNATLEFDYNKGITVYIKNETDSTLLSGLTVKVLDSNMQELSSVVSSGVSVVTAGYKQHIKVLDDSGAYRLIRIDNPEIDNITLYFPPNPVGISFDVPSWLDMNSDLILMKNDTIVHRESLNDGDKLYVNQGDNYNIVITNNYRAWMANGKTIYNNISTETVIPIQNASSMSLKASNVVAYPQSWVNVTVLASSATYTKFNATAPSSDRVEFVIDGLKAGKVYNLYVDGLHAKTARVTSYCIFTFIVTDWSWHTFELKMGSELQGFGLNLLQAYPALAGLLILSCAGMTIIGIMMGREASGEEIEALAKALVMFGVVGLIIGLALAIGMVIT